MKCYDRNRSRLNRNAAIPVSQGTSDDNHPRGVGESELAVVTLAVKSGHELYLSSSLGNHGMPPELRWQIYAYKV